MLLLKQKYLTTHDHYTFGVCLPKVNGSNGRAGVFGRRGGNGRVVSPFASVMDPMHQSIINNERARFVTTKFEPRKRPILSKMRIKVSKAKGTVPSAAETFGGAVKRAGIEQTHLTILLDGYRQLLERYPKLPIEKVNFSFLAQNIPSSNSRMGSVPNPVIMKFVNFAAANKTKFAELQRQKQKKVEIKK
jgi:hypothetical protein